MIHIYTVIANKHVREKQHPSIILIVSPKKGLLSVQTFQTNPFHNTTCYKRVSSCRNLETCETERNVPTQISKPQSHRVLPSKANTMGCSTCESGGQDWPTGDKEGGKFIPAALWLIVNKQTLWERSLCIFVCVNFPNMFRGRFLSKKDPQI